jgi:hypothetical protein
MSIISQKIKELKKIQNNLSTSVIKRKKAIQLEKELITLQKKEREYQQQLDKVNELYKDLSK